ncbi:MAG: sugar transferase [Pseudomonadales bacterium]|nr:sugar transferase [Pseudomonadales bacterium]
MQAQLEPGWSFAKQEILQPLASSKGVHQSLQQLVAFIGLLMISPLLLLTALAIRMDSRGNVIFTQVRVGQHGKRFVMYKFRSMYLTDDPRYLAPETNASNREGICQKIICDPRMTRVGRIIRKLSIDELPQLINVVKGDMVLIGPRPALPQETDQYDWSMLERLDSPAGITGLWQVSGRADLSFDEQIALDIHYVRERTALMDLKILFATVPAVVLGRGAY